MSREIRARQEALAPEGVLYRPLYARVLGLRHLHPSGLVCFLFFEGAAAFGVLLALTELVSWWAIVILPVSIAVMVKVNDLVAGAVARSAQRVAEIEREREASVAVGRAAVVARHRAIEEGAPPVGSWGVPAPAPNAQPTEIDQTEIDQTDVYELRARQSATRRYDD
ncbi:hypothetical protein [Micromonospora sp. CPCC 206061]|uniref:hypothetical protein n=1 Tax=Micromonospora sp. CPCC 206061 TaxID=3122410 RepID=UPI002FF0DDE7